MRPTIKDLRFLILLFIATGVLFTTGCDESDDDDDDLPEATETIYEIISNNPEYAEFKSFYDANVNAMPDIKNGTAPYTVFIPNNAAFDTLRSTLDTEDLTLVAPEVISSVLAFHFVSGVKLEADFGSTLTTYQSENITWNNDNTIIQGGSNTMVEVIASNQVATNGVVHGINRLLYPPSVFLTIGRNLGTIAQPVLLSSAFSGLREIIAKADSEDLGEDKVADILRSPGTYTCFIPADQILDAVAATQQIDRATLIGSLTQTAAAARGLLLNHITDEDIFTGEEIMAGIDANGVGQTFTMLSGLKLTVVKVPVSENTPAGLVLAVDPQDEDTYIPIFQPDLFDFNDLGSGVNGAVHVSAPITATP